MVAETVRSRLDLLLEKSTTHRAGMDHTGDRQQSLVPGQRVYSATASDGPTDGPVCPFEQPAMQSTYHESGRRMHVFPDPD